VEIIIVDGWGKSIRAATAVVEGNGASKSLNIDSRGNVSLPHGRYKLVCSSTRYFYDMSLSIEVRTPTSQVLVGLPMKGAAQVYGEGSRTLWRISGTVLSSQKRPRFVKFAGVYMPVSQVAEVDAKGRFEATLLWQGLYEILVLDRDQIVYRETLDLDMTIPKESDLSIRLAADPTH
jgi:hypothetical protein